MYIRYKRLSANIKSVTYDKAFHIRLITFEYLPIFLNIELYGIEEYNKYNK